MLPIVGSIYFCGTSILGHWDTGVLRGLVAFFGNSGCGSGLTASWVLVSPATNSAAFSASTNSATYVQCPFFFSMCALIAPARVAFSTNLCSIACWVSRGGAGKSILISMVSMCFSIRLFAHSPVRRLTLFEVIDELLELIHPPLVCLAIRVPRHAA